MEIHPYIIESYWIPDLRHPKTGMVRLGVYLVDSDGRYTWYPSPDADDVEGLEGTVARTIRDRHGKAFNPIGEHVVLSPPHFLTPSMGIAKAAHAYAKSHAELGWKEAMSSWSNRYYEERRESLKRSSIPCPLARVVCDSCHGLVTVPRVEGGVGEVECPDCGAEITYDYEDQYTAPTDDRKDDDQG